KIGEVIVEEVERRQICQRTRKREVGEGVGIKVKPDQITSRFQSLHAADTPTARVQARQAQQILLGQRPAGFLQRVADRGVQAWVRNGHLLRECRSHEGGENYRRKDAKYGSVAVVHAGGKSG